MNKKSCSLLSTISVLKHAEIISQVLNLPFSRLDVSIEAIS